MSKHITIMLAIAAALCLAAGSASAEVSEEEVSPVDWEDAYDYAEILDTFEENGETWVTYWDEAQDLMWSIPACASKEDLLETAGLGGGGSTRDLCAIVWPVPYSLTIKEDNDNYDTMYYPNEFDYEGGSATYRTWSAFGTGCFLNCCGYVWSYVRNTKSYCSPPGHPYLGAYYDHDSGGGWPDADDQDCYTPSSYTYYESYETHDIACESAWDYCSSSTEVVRHEFYACNQWRYLQINFEHIPE